MNFKLNNFIFYSSDSKLYDKSPVYPFLITAFITFFSLGSKKKEGDEPLPLKVASVNSNPSIFNFTLIFL